MKRCKLWINGRQGLKLRGPTGLWSKKVELGGSENNKSCFCYTVQGHRRHQIQVDPNNTVWGWCPSNIHLATDDLRTTTQWGQNLSKFIWTNFHMPPCFTKYVFRYFQFLKNGKFENISLNCSGKRFRLRIQKDFDHCVQQRPLKNVFSRIIKK